MRPTTLLVAVFASAVAAFPCSPLYKQFRKLPARTLWKIEVPRYEQLSAIEREKQVDLVRAVGVKFAAGEHDAGTKQEVADWLGRLLKDPSEKVRRYAATALPKIGTSGEGIAVSERLLLDLLASSELERERAAVAAALSKIGGDATLSALESADADSDGPLKLPSGALDEQRLRARVARGVAPGAINLDARLPMEACAGLVLHLRCRRGLERIVESELAEAAAVTSLPLRSVSVRSGCVVAEVDDAGAASFSLGDLYRLRCFDTVGFVLRGRTDGAGAKRPLTNGARNDDEDDEDDAVAAAIASDVCERLMATLTNGAPRYRLQVEAVAAGKRARVPARGKAAPRTVKAVDARIARIARAAYARNPHVLNDARQAMWMMDVTATGSVELRPKLSPNPRLPYQTKTFYAGSHPPITACMARLARPYEPNEIVWDPFCGTGMELIEAAIASETKVATLIGTDLDAGALETAAENVAAAKRCEQLLPAPRNALDASFHRCDFRDGASRVEEIRDGRVSLIITNPPLGHRVQVTNLHALFVDLFDTAARALRPGGRLVFVNPLRLRPPPGSSLTLEGQTTVDLGLRRDCSMEVWRQRE